MTFPTRLTHRKKILSEINVTPFVDVMLVLLIIFMVTAPFLESEISVKLPETEASKPTQRKETTPILKIDKNEQIFIDKKKYTLKDLSKSLSDIYRARKNKEIFVHADSGLTYGYVAQVMATLQKAGVDKIGLVTTPVSK